MIIIKKKTWHELNGLDIVFGFGILKIVNLTAFSVHRDGGFFIYEQ